MIEKYIPEKYLRKTFKISLIFKFADGVIELIGGFLLLFVSPEKLVSLIGIMTQYELSEDPKDVIANYLLNMSQQVSLNPEVFGALYLLSHGLIKVFIVFGLLKNKLFAYPLGIIVFTAFGVYQMYRYTFTHSPWLLALTVLDAIIIFLTWHEYRYVKKQRSS